jgi:hypothetical protein
MRSPYRPVVIALIGLMAAACTSPSTSPSTSPDDGMTASPVPTSTPLGSDAGSPPATSEPIPSDELGPFTCDLPIHVDQTVARANITDVRVGTHDGYDRVVFEFAGGLPEASIERAEPPFTHDASGEPIEVEGESFLRLILRGGTKQQDDGTSSYDGATEFEPNAHTLLHIIEGGDFEAQSTWYFGLTEEECVRVLTLIDDGGARLVIDVEH